MDPETLAEIVAGARAEDLSLEEASALEALTAGDTPSPELERALAELDADPFLGLASLRALGVSHAPLAEEAPAPSAAQWERVREGIWAAVEGNQASGNQASGDQPAAPQRQPATGEDLAPILRFPTAPVRGRNLPALIMLAAGLLLAGGLAFVIGTQGERNRLGAEGTAMVLPEPGTGDDPEVSVGELGPPRALVLEGPPAEVLKVEAGPGFQAQTQVIGENLLCVVLLEKR